MSPITEQEYKIKIEELQKEIEILKKKQTEKMKSERYGLNWIDVPEAFEKESEDKIPVLKEVKDKAIKNEDGKPTHILIEGDNYHALKCLNYTHAGKIDVIYIDPPYNTGSDGFIYKDARFLEQFPDGTTIPKEHPLRHSTWLSFMSKRLKLARNLLSEKGVIFISIDDNEQANLKLLCDQVFGEENCIATLPTIMNLKGNQDEFGFAGTHEYTIVYGKNIQKTFIGKFPINDEEKLSEWIEDDIGLYKEGATLKRTGLDAPREKRPYGFFPILVNKKSETICMIKKEEYESIYDKSSKCFSDSYIENLREKYESQNYSFILPESDGIKTSWRWSFEKVKNEKDEIIIKKTKDGYSLYKKQRPELGDLPSEKPKSIFYKAEYSSGNGTSQVKDIFRNKIFNNPKPIELIKDFIQLSTGNSQFPKVLDFFAGSGTTLHATMKLNAEDGGNRQCILVQQKETDSNICESITYERNRRVINGYTNSKGEEIPGLGNSLKYYKTDFIGEHSEKLASDEDKILLAQKAGCLISLSENTLEEIKTTEYYQLYTDGKKLTAIYFNEDPEMFPDFVEDIAEVSVNSTTTHKTTVYVYCEGNPEIYENEFDDLTNIEIKAIPHPILQIYKTLNEAR